MFHNEKQNRAAKPTAITPVPPRRTAPAPFFPVDEEPVGFESLPVPFALAWNASKVFALDSFAFAAKTMPSAQWPTWRQYAQIGLVSFTWTVYVGNVVAFALTGLLNRIVSDLRERRKMGEEGRTTPSQSRLDRLWNLRRAPDKDWQSWIA